MAKAKKQVKEATISETKEKKKKEEVVEEVVEEVEETKVKEEKEPKKEEKPKKEKKKREGLFGGIRREMKQVVWPSAGNIVKSTIAVVVICIFLALFFEAIMLFMAWLKVFLKGLFV